MTLRLSLLSRNRSMIANNQENLQRVTTLQEQLSSGRRVQTVSDDPTSVRRALSFRVERFDTERFQENASRAGTFLTVTDTSISEMVDLVSQLKENTVSGASGTQDQSSRKALARSVDAQLTRMVDLANTKHDGRFIFSGTEVFTPPFELNDTGGRVDYRGNQDTFAVQISSSESVQVNQNGAELFQGGVDVFEVIIAVRDALENDDGAELTRLIEDVDAVQEQLGLLHGEVGGRQQRIELADRQLSEVHTQLSALISEEIDTDMSATIMNLQALSGGDGSRLTNECRILQPSLLDFL